MSLDKIEYDGKEVLYFNLEDVRNNKNKIEHIDRLNKWLRQSDEMVLVLINVSNFMPGPDFMEFATVTLNERAKKIKKAAYFGLGKKNKKAYEYFDIYNHDAVERNSFEDMASALEWLVRDC